MKTLKDLFELIAQATEETQREYNSTDWFFDYHGHVQKMSVSYWFTGWKEGGVFESIEQKLDEDGIQALYYFIKTRL